MDPARERKEMVEYQLALRGISDPAVLKAMGEVPREMFVPESLTDFAYQDSPLPIGDGQTISQPYIVALMTEALELKPGDRVLEIGTGSGYGAAVLSRIASQVYTIERLPDLAEKAERRFVQLHYDNISVLVGDGSLGWTEHAPFDAVSVTAGAPEVPGPLLDQLAEGGRLVIPVGRFARFQELVRVRRMKGEFLRDELGSVAFVPLVGAKGWEEPIGKLYEPRKR